MNECTITWDSWSRHVRFMYLFSEIPFARIVLSHLQISMPMNLQNAELIYAQTEFCPFPAAPRSPSHWPHALMLIPPLAAAPR